MRNRGPRMILVAAAALAAACDATPNAGVVRRDSAGVAIVESHVAAWSEGEGWGVGTAPLLDLAAAGTGPAHEFGRVESAARRGDGTILVADRDLLEVRLYGADGSFVWASGRRGQGPGEFQWLTDVAPYLGDSVMVFDDRAARATILDAGGAAARTIALPPGEILQRLRPLGDGSFVGTTVGVGEVTAARSGVYHEMYALVRISPEGTLLDTLTVLPGWEGYAEEGRTVIPVFPRRAHVDTNGTDVVAGFPEGMRYARFAADGRQLQSVRAPLLERPLDAQDARLEREAMVPDGAPPEHRNLVQRMPVPPLWPAYRDMRIDSDGHVWLAEYDSPRRREREAPTRWHVFSADGAYLGDVETPGRFFVREIGRDYVLGWYDGRAGAYSVQVLPLER